MSTATKLSRVEEVVEHLAQQILAKPEGDDDQWLPKTAELSEQFGVSRTVMREAISRLESQGLIESKHGVGLRVVRRLHKPVMASLSLLLPDDIDRLRQAMAARFLLEVEIARLAATRLDDAGLRRLLTAQAILAEPDVTVEDAVEADTDFHQTLADQCGNEVLKLMLESIVELCRESRQLTISRTGVDRPYVSHQRIIEAIARQDADAAAEAMRQHLDYTRHDLGMQLAEMEAEKQDHSSSTASTTDTDNASHIER